MTDIPAESIKPQIGDLLKLGNERGNSASVVTAISSEDPFTVQLSGETTWINLAEVDATQVDREGDATPASWQIVGKAETKDWMGIITAQRIQVESRDEKNTQLKTDIATTEERLGKALQTQDERISALILEKGKIESQVKDLQRQLDRKRNSDLAELKQVQADRDQAQQALLDEQKRVGTLIKEKENLAAQLTSAGQVDNAKPKIEVKTLIQFFAHNKPEELAEADVELQQLRNDGWQVENETVGNTFPKSGDKGFTRIIRLERPIQTEPSDDWQRQTQAIPPVEEPELEPPSDDAQDIEAEYIGDTEDYEAESETEEITALISEACPHLVQIINIGAEGYLQNAEQRIMSAIDNAPQVELPRPWLERQSDNLFADEPYAETITLDLS